MRRFVCLTAVLCAIHARATDVNHSAMDLAAGKVAPLTVTFGQLQGTWMQFDYTVRPTAPTDPREELARRLSADAVQAAELLLPSPLRAITRGDAVTVEGLLYLVAYRRDLLGEPCPTTEAEEEPDLGWKPETKLGLELVPLATAGALHHLVPFTVAAALAQRDATRLSRLRQKAKTRVMQLGLAVMQFAQDHGGRLPPFDSIAGRREALRPYLNSGQVFDDPLSGTPFEFNRSLAGARLSQVASPAETVLVYQTAADDDGMRLVGFADGHTRAISEEDWPRPRAGVNQPAPPLRQ